jgi:hypothetical protein
LIVGYGNFYADLGGVIKHGSGLAMGDEMPEAKSDIISRSRPCYPSMSFQKERSEASIVPFSLSLIVLSHL